MLWPGPLCIPLEDAQLLWMGVAVGLLLGGWLVLLLVAWSGLLLGVLLGLVSVAWLALLLLLVEGCRFFGMAPVDARGMLAWGCGTEGLGGWET